MKHFTPKYILSLLVIIFLFVFSSQIKAQIFFEDDCNNVKGSGYSEEYMKYSYVWDTLNGGHSTNSGIPGSGSPAYAYEGNLNYIFKAGNNGSQTILILPPLDLQFALKPQLRFRHAMADWAGDFDELRILFKKNPQAAWDTIKTYTLPQEDWILREVSLPDVDLSDSCLVGFEGTYLFGHGICIDSIRVIETEVTQLSLDSTVVTQVNDAYTPSGSNNNPVLLLNLSVSGNNGNLPLNSITVTSLNDNDNDILSNGVKLFVSEEPKFSGATQIASGVSFVSGKAAFSGINYMLKTGFNYIWVTYDINSAATHLDKFDGYIVDNDITVDGILSSPVVGSPFGNGVIYESIFFDDFESDKSWTLNGEWERDVPQGLGNNTGFNADPVSAHSGNNIIGTDITGLGSFPGDYETAINNSNIWYAVSPTINCKYYRDINFSCYRYLNIENQDTATVDLSIDNGNNWETVWNNQLLRDNDWKLFELDVTDIIEREQEVKIRFSLGPTDSIRNLSGWNIDDFALTGNLIEKDLTITNWVAPITNCGFLDNEQVTVEVKNLAVSTALPPIPICFSIDGDTVFYDTITASIPVDSSIQFTFSHTVDLSEPKIYHNAFAAINQIGDEDNQNDSMKTIIYALPNITLPNKNDFNNEFSYWQPGGTNSSWEYGIPKGSAINKAATGAYAWVTNLSGRYNDNENSYIESPCYDLSTVERPLLSIRYIYETETNVDGLQLQYSIDDGFSWHAIEKHPTYSYNWNWYDNIVSSLGGKGGSGTSTVWERALVVLPDAVLSQASVKFRVAFASNNSVNYFEGVGIDDLVLFEAPIDIGVSSIDNITDLCQYENPENVQFTVKNYGNRKLFFGDTIVVGLKLNDETTIIDSFQLTSDMIPNASEQFTFAQKIHLDEAGSQTLRSFTLSETLPNFYGSVSNDTSTLIVNIAQSPITNMADTIATMNVDTVVLRPQYSPSYSYLWNDGDTTRLKDTIYYGLYTLIVTDEISKGGNGCTTPDTVRVQVLFSDVGSAGILLPVNSCELTSSTLITVGVRNEGNDTLRIGQKIPVALSMDGSPFIYDTITLTSEVWPKKVYSYEFSSTPMDMSAIKTYDFTMFTIFEGDTIHETDTATTKVSAWGYPTVDIGPDNIYHKGTYYIFNIASTINDYKTVQWSDGSNTSTYLANTTGYHSIDVTDFHDCPATDSSYLQLLIRDIKPVSLVSPISECGAPNNTDITISLQNTGTDTLKIGDKYNLSYDLSDTSGFFNNYVNDIIDISTEIYPGGIFMYTFTNQELIENFGLFNFNIYINSALDMINTNDTLNSSVEFFQIPVVDFAEDVNGWDVVNQYSTHLNVNLNNPNFYPTWKDGTHESELTITYPDNGQYWCTVEDTTSSCFDRDTVTIIFEITDYGVIDILSPPAVCASDFNSVFVQIKSFGNVAYLKNNKNLSIVYTYSGSKPKYDTVDIDIPGNGTITYEVSNLNIVANGSSEFKFYIEYEGDIKSDNDTTTKMIEIKDSPFLTWQAIDTLNCPATLDATQSEPGASYVWQDGSIGKSYLVNYEGNYSVNISFPDGCDDNFITYIHCGDVQNVVETFEENNILIYPNPANDYITINFSNLKEKEFFIDLLDLNGRVLWNGKKEKSVSETNINLEKYYSGMYFLRIYNQEKTTSLKIIIE